MQPLLFENGVLQIIDQAKLPGSINYLKLKNHQSVAQAIKDMSVRGAPAIGIAAAYGIALGASQIKTDDLAVFLTELEQVVTTITSTRPTANSLSCTAYHMLEVANNCSATSDAILRLMEEAVNIHNQQIEIDQLICRFAAGIIPEKATILTHCNSGSLATGAIGTALGAIIYAHRQGKNIHVIATETRPLLQGARLTAFELKEACVPFKLITDSMAGYYMSSGMIDLVVTGADRIATNGDTANKIGTYTLAVLARYHNIPFYVAAPSSTFDLSTPDGSKIVIEERDPLEVTSFMGNPIAPNGTDAFNPAFDITPGSLVSAFITDSGIIEPGDILNKSTLFDVSIPDKTLQAPPADQIKQ